VTSSIRPRHLVSIILTIIFGTLLCLNAGASLVTDALDQIGQKYEMDKNGDVILSFVVNNNEMTVGFSVKPVGDKGDIAFLYSGSAEEGVSALICRLTPQCRGIMLKSAIDSFINAAFSFRTRQKENAGPVATAPVQNEAYSAETQAAPSAPAATPERKQSAAVANTEPFTINDMWVIQYGNAVQIITAYENTSGRPIRALRVTYTVRDDFGDPAIRLKPEFTASSTYLGGDDKTQGHIIQPGEIIYHCDTSIDDIEQANFFASREALLKELSMTEDAFAGHRVDKKLELKIDKIVYADE